MKHHLQKLCWILAAILGIAGLGVRFFVPGFHFTGFLLVGFGLLAAAYGLLAGICRKHRKGGKIAVILLTLAVAAGLAGAAVTGRMIARGAAGNPACTDYVVVLGAGVNGTEPSLSLQERLQAAACYLEACPEAVCVVSGGRGNGEDITEAACMFRELTAMGIAPERIWQEDQAVNTRENIRFSLDLIQKKRGVRPEKIGLVSSEYHLYRAGMLARQEQTEIYGIPARTGWRLLRWNYYLREIAAVWYYSIIGGMK